ncbi:hypothetical protein KY343_07255 [Candidatus Woesearchaeota archaeon]|nr:hypothetical protein [Candidatus Woesearchaeota archaeon]
MIIIKKCPIFFDFFLEIPLLRIKTVLLRESMEAYYFEILGFEIKFIKWSFRIRFTLDIMYWRMRREQKKEAAKFISKGKALTYQGDQYGLKRRWWKLEFIDYIFRKRIQGVIKNGNRY